MAVVHNCIIRGLNAIYLQAPHVGESQDIEDFQFLVYAWCIWVQAHHHLEDDVMFPLFAEVGGKPGMLQESSAQHQEFVEGIEQLLNLSKAPVSEYSSSQLRTIIDDFAPAMHRHFSAEVDDLMALTKYDSAALLKAYHTSEEGIRHLDDETKAQIFPLALGLRDINYEEGNRWPHLPSELEKDVVDRLAPLHAGAWRFLPCGFDGQQRRLRDEPGS